MPILLVLLLTACGSSRVSHIVRVEGSVGPLRVDQSNRSQVIAYVGTPSVEHRGQGESGRYDVLGYSCSRHPGGTIDYLINCRTAFYLVEGRLGLFVTHDRVYSEAHGVRIGMATAKAERRLHRRVRPGCAEDIYLGSKRASLTVDFAGGKPRIVNQAAQSLVGGHVDAFALHSRRHDPGVTDCL